MSKIDFTFSVEQIFPDGKSEYHLLSNSTFHESVPMKSLFSSFEHQVMYWLEQEAQTDSSYRFSFTIMPTNSESWK